MTDLDKRIKGAMNMAVRQRNYRRARDRAMRRLSNAYPETYKELLEQEKIVDEQMGKKWLAGYLSLVVALLALSLFLFFFIKL